MNREMRRLMEREERRQKKQDKPTAAARRAAAARAPRAERKPLWQRVRGFMHDVRQEMKKVTWPTQEQMVAFTTVTVITSLALTAIVFGFDVVMKELVLFVIERS